MEPMDSQNPAASSTTTPSATFNPQEASRSDVDEILRRKRKAREYKACYPCRQRKVKCDQAVPCKTCIAREHPELCTYHPPAESHPPAKRLNHGSNNGTLDSPSGGLSIHFNVNGTVTLGREDWEGLCSKLNSVERSLMDLKTTMRVASEGTGAQNGHIESATGTPSRASASEPSNQQQTNTQGIHTTNSITGQTVHLGSSSVPALVMALGKGEGGSAPVQELLGKNVLPLFGLDNESATYPFVDLWGLPHGSMNRIYELCNALPNDSDCWNLLKYHKETAHVVFPAVADIEKLESELLRFLISRGSSRTHEDGSITGVTEQSIFGKDLHWVGLLFAVLASGCQCSALPRKERELTSQVYVCCSFECLRITNFLSHSRLETIQTLLILGNVISNNMNAGVAWSLLGLTIRLAQSQGLHRSCPSSISEEMKLIRKKIWWTVLWQDSLLSITYDRASSMSTNETVPLNPESSPGNRPYIECMYRLCKVGLDIVSERSFNHDVNETMTRITQRRQEIQDIMLDAADYLRDSRKCRSMRNQLEHWALYLHMSYMMSELCRPAISPALAEHELARSTRKACVDSLTNTVEAFLGLQNMTVFASRSWTAVHRSISCALLLGILKEHERNERARMLLEKLISVLTEITSKVDPAELSAPITRSMMALRKLLNMADSAKQSLPSLSNVGQSIVPASSSAATPPLSNSLAYGLDDMNGLMGVDGFGSLGQSPLMSDLDLEQSPYALMDSIIWGVKKTPPG
ncbi:fungal-specific transcription factor domain-containing protein [Phyllosticta citrichinensis]|uniref:Fungal-specific transcription factor domain-containing protein n=1 Tax=Phyllosticta citrichinensis TaxID=1130410 RepID=A0ABR1XHI4_9PEZI